MPRAACFVVGTLFAPAALGACGLTEGLILGQSQAIADAAATDAMTGIFDAEPAPTAPTLTGETLTTEQGGDGGTAYIELCPESQVVIGYKGFLTGPAVGLILVGGIQALCGVLGFAGSTVTTSAGVTLPLRGTSEATSWSQTCPPNEIVVGFSGRSGADLDQVAFQCAAWTASGDGGEGLTSGSFVSLAPTGGDGGSPYANVCPAGQVARGSTLRAGEWIDAFGLVCGALALATEDGEE